MAVLADFALAGVAMRPRVFCPIAVLMIYVHFAGHSWYLSSNLLISAHSKAAFF
jgi:hypothetical protein